MRKDRVVWCNRGWFPVYYGFCPSKAAWDYEMKRLGGVGEAYPETDGRTCQYFHEESGKTCLIVTLADRMDDVDDPIGVAGLIVHEAAHVWQLIRRHIGEEEAGMETDAYALQAISTELMNAYASTRLGAK